MSTAQDFDILDTLNVWRPFSHEGSRVYGPFCVDRVELYVPGADRTETYTAGSQRSEVYVPGADRLESC